MFLSCTFNAGISSRSHNKHWPSAFDPGLKQIFEISNGCNMVTQTKFCEASNMMRTTLPELLSSTLKTEELDSTESDKIINHVDSSLLWIIKKHCDKIMLRDADRKPKTSKKRARRSSTGSECKQKNPEIVEDWQGPPPWDLSSGGDGCPKFLCDVMVCLIKSYFKVQTH